MPPVSVGSGDQISELTAELDDLRAKLAERTEELEKILQEQRKEACRIQAILASLAEGVLLEDQNSQIIMMNAAAQDLLAVLSEQFQAMKPVREVEAASDARRFEIGDRIIVRIITAGRSRIAYTSRINICLGKSIIYC